MKQRCLNPNNAKYPIYGGRGITIHPRWVASFEAFLQDMGERPIGTTIERKNSNGNYEPGNCIWATSVAQNRNRSNTRKLVIAGVEKPLAEWAELNGLNPGILRSRIRQGWPESRLLEKSQRQK